MNRRERRSAGHRRPRPLTPEQAEELLARILRDVERRELADMFRQVAAEKCEHVTDADLARAFAELDLGRMTAPFGHALADDDDLDASVEEMVQRHGWAVQAVMSDGMMPSWSYTVGLCRYEMPEVITMSPAGTETAAAIMLNALAKGVREHGAPPLEPGPRAIGDGIVGWLLDVSDPESAEFPLTQAVRYADRHQLTVRAVQLVCPDEAGRLPWHADYAGFRQALLGEPPA